MTDVLDHGLAWPGNIAGMTDYATAWDFTDQSWLWGPTDPSQGP
jgi:hypothetical protein